MDKILIVEDDLVLSAGLCFELDTAGYATVAAYTCKKAAYFLETEQFSLVVLDVNLPDGNGFDLCHSIKENHPGLPVIFLTAHDLEDEVLGGLDLGAEDYVTKPFSTGIFCKKVEIILRRTERNSNAIGHCFDDGTLCIDLNNLTAILDGEKLSITPNEYKILKLLIAHSGTIVTRQILLEKLFDCDENYIDDHSLTVGINRLRNKIEKEGHTYIKTVRGMGYAWMGKSR